jgi:quercetin dioxygenase-like cupin family protein
MTFPFKQHEQQGAQSNLRIYDFFSSVTSVIKTILKKSTGNISVMSFDSGEGLTERTTPFDTFAQIIDGKAEIVIGGESHFLGTGQSIVIPAHISNLVRPNGRFKMILTVIKGGYE